MKAQIKTKSNYRNLNGTWLPVVEIVGNRVSCLYFSKEFEKDITIDFVIDEISKLDVNKSDLVVLLSNNAALAKFCNWDELTGNNWTTLLREQDIFSKFCKWEKLDGFNWAVLLYNKPKLSKFCDWSKLNDFDWYILQKKHPKFAKFRK